MLTLFVKAFAASANYYAVLFIMFNSFSLGHYYMINGHERYQQGWEENLRQAYLIQFNMVFGSFSEEYETNTVF